MYLSDAALAAAKKVQQTFAQEWKKTGWVPGTWVHWATGHSRVFLSGYRCLYSFVYDVDDELGASKGRHKHPCFYDGGL